MVAVWGWLDDSRREAIWSVGGYVGGEFQWEYFEEHWPAALRAAGVPYFHMREMGKANGPFDKWHPPTEHEPARRAFLSSLTNVIVESHLFGILSGVRCGDLERFNKERGLTLEPYPLGAYGCMLLAARQNLRRMRIHLVFDRVEKVESKLATARTYADADKYWQGECDAVTVTGLAKGVQLQDLPAMQAADFIAWEFRRAQERREEWHATTSVPADADEAWEQLEEWIIAKFGSHEASIRKSAIALIEPQRFANLVWDYRTLNEVHDLRDRVWT
jgi:hypothetical protein